MSTTVQLPSLPQSNEARQELKRHIKEFMERISESIEEERKISSSQFSSNLIWKLEAKQQILERRLRLIDRCDEFSLLRINHLEEIFKYYCTHIYKVGKHMTFDRLEFEKEHLTMERFFLFLKDFGLTSAEIDGKQRDIIDRQVVILVFKRASSTCRELTFEEFIKCLEKLAVIYYDEKENYHLKREKEQLERIRRKKEIEKRKVKRMQVNGIKVDDKQLEQLSKLEQQEKSIQSSEKAQEQEEGTGQQEKQEEAKDSDSEDSQKQAVKQQQKPTEKEAEERPEVLNDEFSNENDDLIKEMMENKDLEDPNEEVNKASRKTKEEIKNLQNQKKRQAELEQELLKLSSNEIIEYFYQVIGVDSVKQYKKKLTELNMTEFKVKQQEKNKRRSDMGLSHNNPQSAEDSRVLASSIQNSVEEEERLQKIKQKMLEQRQRKKQAPIPKPKEVQESETTRKRRQMKAQREIRAKQKKQQAIDDAINQKKKDQYSKRNEVKSAKKVDKSATIDVPPPPKRVEFNEKEVNWAMLEKISLDQMRLRQFNPAKLYQQDDDDYIFLQEYGGVKPPLSHRQRQSISIVQGVKKRVGQVQKSQKSQENKLIDKISQGRRSFKGKF